MFYLSPHAHPFPFFDARSEFHLAERLKDCLEDNAWVWHNIPMEPFGRCPDFVALHPHQGIVVLEVKDWHQDTIIGASKTHVELLTSQRTVSVESPFAPAATEHTRK